MTELRYRRNGLRVIHVPMPGTESVTSTIVYLVGSRHEARGKTGIAHMLEHMLFKETRDAHGVKQKPRYIALENKGAVLNATTWTDRTNYYFCMPKEYIDEILHAEAERMRGLLLTEKTFKPEQQNVLSEYEMYSEKPEFLLDSAINSLSFVSHGYGHDTIGSREDIANLTHTDLQHFYDTYYWPNNAYLIIVGDISLERVKQSVHRHFAHRHSSPTSTPPVKIQEPRPLGRKTVHIERASPLSLITCAYHVPEVTHPDWATLRIIAAYLAESKLSPLYKLLVDTHRASSVSALLYPTHDPFLFTLHATASKGQPLDRVRDIIEAEVARLHTTRLVSKDLLRVKRRIESTLLSQRDGTQSIAHELTEYVAAGDWTLFQTLPARIQAVTPDDILRVSREYLRQEIAIIGTFKGTLS